MTSSPTPNTKAPEGAGYPDDIRASASWALMGHWIDFDFGKERKERLLQDICYCLLAERKAFDWHSMEDAPQDRRILAVVDGEVRTVRYGKTSHVPLYGFCLADQGPEDFDLCQPTAWMPMPALPSEPTLPRPQQIEGESATQAAAEDRALINASDPTRNEPQAKGEIGNV